MERLQISRTDQTAGHERKSSLSYARPLPSHPSQPPLLSFTRALGNQATAVFLQAKIKVNEPGDIYEQEADRITDQVMRMPNPSPPTFSQGAGPHLQRKCAACASGQGLCPKCAEEEMTVQRETKDSNLSGAEAQPLVHEVLNSRGEPLDPATRAFFEPRFGHDFSQVCVHTGPQAADSARAVQARAYTTGHDVVFAAGEYAPATTAGRRLLAHELAHVVQQGGTAGPAATSSVLQRDAVPGGAAEALCPGNVRSRIANFWTDVSGLSANQQREADAIAAELVKDNPAKIKLTGHTDSAGSEAYNVALGQRRAESVKKHLEGKHVKATMATASMGKSCPLENTQAVDGRNRRVDIEVEDQPPAAPSQPSSSEQPPKTLPPPLAPYAQAGPNIMNDRQLRSKDCAMQCGLAYHKTKDKNQYQGCFSRCGSDDKYMEVLKTCVTSATSKIAGSLGGAANLGDEAFRKAVQMCVDTYGGTSPQMPEPPQQQPHLEPGQEPAGSQRPQQGPSKPNIGPFNIPFSF